MMVILWLSPADSHVNHQNTSQNKTRSNPEIYYPGNEILYTTDFLA